MGFEDEAELMFLPHFTVFLKGGQCLGKEAVETEDGPDSRGSQDFHLRGGVFGRGAGRGEKSQTT